MDKLSCNKREQDNRKGWTRHLMTLFDGNVRCNIRLFPPEKLTSQSFCNTDRQDAELRLVIFPFEYGLVLENVVIM